MKFSIIDFQFLKRGVTRGFTLIELLVVIAVISVLLGLAFPNFYAARQRARDAQRKSDLKQIQKALELYKSDQNPVEYPTNTSPWPAHITGTACDTRWAVGSEIYMPKVPCDPVTNQLYIYERDATDNNKYYLKACLENGSDPDLDNPLDLAVCPAATNTYSYTIREP